MECARGQTDARPGKKEGRKEAGREWRSGGTAALLFCRHKSWWARGHGEGGGLSAALAAVRVKVFTRTLFGRLKILNRLLPLESERIQCLREKDGKATEMPRERLNAKTVLTG